MADYWDPMYSYYSSTIQLYVRCEGVTKNERKKMNGSNEARARFRNRALKWRETCMRGVSCFVSLFMWCSVLFI